MLLSLLLIFDQISKEFKSCMSLECIFHSSAIGLYFSLLWSPSCQSFWCEGPRGHSQPLQMCSGRGHDGPLLSEVILKARAPSTSSCQKFFFWGGPHCKSCGILVPQPGFEPGSSALEAWSLYHWTAKEVALQNFVKELLSCHFFQKLLVSQSK